MNTPEQPASPPLTRKQMREMRNTGATPIVTHVADAEPAPEAAAPAAPLPRPAEPVVVPEPPVPDAAVDLGVSPLTRRQARQQERIRTASVPVITPDVVAAHTAATAAEAGPAEQPAEEDAVARLFAGGPAVPDAQPQAAEPDATPEGPGPATQAFDALGLGEQSEPEPEVAPPAASEPSDGDERVVGAHLGAGVLAAGAASAEVPPSFDQLLTPSSSGSSSTPNALIMSQTPTAAPIVAPVTSTGDVIVTGTFNLPEGLGSTGHAAGTADGKEVDAVLVDGELPAHSSPTPIAASAAISTHKSAGEVITPPTPEKGGRLMMVLAITAGVLALALVGVLILAFVTGVFS